MNKDAIFAGIDVSKHCLDSGLTGDGKVERFENTEIGIADLTAILLKIQPTLIVVEATGGLEMLVVAALPIAVANARPESRYFCESLLGASQPQQAEKITRPLMPSAAPIRPPRLVPTQQGVGT